MDTNEAKAGMPKGFPILLLGIICGPFLHGLLLRRGVPTVAVAAAIGLLWGIAGWASQKVAGDRVNVQAALFSAVAGVAGSLLASSV
jgi:hypothetical protein